MNTPFLTGQAWVDFFLDPTATFVGDDTDVLDMVWNHRDLFDRYMAFIGLNPP